MSKYKAVGFDWSGVMYFYSASYADVVRDLFGISSEEFYEVYYKYNHLLNTANADKNEVWGQILSHFGKENEVASFLQYLKELPSGHLHEEMLVLIHEIKKQGYKVGLFGNHTLDGAKEARTLGLDNIFDVVIFSAEVGVMKPQKEAYLLLAQKLDVDITELIFIDDTEKSLSNAETIGYTPILYSNMEKLRFELSELLSLNMSKAENHTPKKEIHVDPRHTDHAFDLPFWRDNEKLWALEVPTKDMSIDELLWILDVPFWEDTDGNIVITPNEVINNLDNYPEHRDRIKTADTSFPIDIMKNKKGEWLTLDGLHRLVRLVMEGAPTVRVRKIPPELIHLTARDE